MAGHFTPGDQFQFTCSTLTDPAGSSVAGRASLVRTDPRGLRRGGMLTSCNEGKRL